ncbi:MAG: hypothetical protein V1745_00210 [Patescibacteria group bacterium]
MKKALRILLTFSILTLVVYSAYRGVMWVGGWIVDERPHAQAARAIEGTLDKAIEATNDTSWFNRWMTGQPPKKRK